MYLRIFVLFIILAISLTHFNCMPTLLSAKIQLDFSVDGTYLGAFSTTSAQDEDGNDVTDTDVDFDLPIPFDVKFRYGWEREENFGFELSGGLDGQIGAYLETVCVFALHTVLEQFTEIVFRTKIVSFVVFEFLVHMPLALHG